MLTDFMRIISYYVGTMVPCPAWAHEQLVSPKLLIASNAHGWCIDKNSINLIVAKCLEMPNLSTSLLRELNKLIKITHNLPDGKTHVILLACFNQKKLHGLKQHILAHNITVNHERMHAVMMTRSQKWHLFVDTSMARWFKEWDNCLMQLFNSYTIYNAIIKERDYEPSDIAWMATEEILARCAVLDHVQEGDKNWAAEYELARAKTDLLALHAEIIDRWGSVMELIGWMDAHVPLQ